MSDELREAARQLKLMGARYEKGVATIKEVDEAVEGWLLVRERRD
jgi:outer membrane protein TolC